MRIVIIGTILLVIAGLNLLVGRALWQTHRKSWQRAILVAALVCGNLLWPFVRTVFTLPSSPSSRLLRALLGPPWFSWLLFLLIYSAFVLSTTIVWRITRPSVAYGEFAAKRSAVFLLFLLVAAVAGFIQALVPLRVSNVPVTIATLPSGGEGYRIALLTDLHVGLFTRRSRLQRFVAEVNRARPDVVLLGGDLIDDDPFYVDKLVAALSSIDGSIPIFAVLGNHEMYGNPGKVAEEFSGSRVRLLINEGVALAGGRLWLAGLSDYAAEVRRGAPAPDLKRALTGRPGGVPTVVLAHQPKAFADARAEGAELTLVGHTHGGQCGFRPLGFSVAGLFLPYHMGLYRAGASQLYVNTGTGYWVVPFRLGMTPEITIVELK